MNQDLVTLCHNIITQLQQEVKVGFDEYLVECGSAPLHLLTNLLESFHPSDHSLLLAQSLIDFAHYQILSHPYHAVPNAYRRLFTDASLISACTLALREGSAREVVGVCDLAIVVAGAPGAGRREMLDRILEEAIRTERLKKKKRKLANDVFQMQQEVELLPHLTIKHPVAKLPAPPSIEWFMKHILNNPTPIIIPREAISHWPALSRWSPSYLIELAGERLVPIEIGKAYTESRWTQKLMPLDKFITRYMLNTRRNTLEEGEVAYLAQHDLLAQIPRLKQDIMIPDYCFTTDNTVLTNVWIGPAGTVSPLHHDPYHNLFVQVVGSKFFRLHSPNETKYLYPHDDGMLSNTSQVDPERVDVKRFPLYNSAEYIDCVIGPGEVLYVPPGWWHYVKSLSTSFSVSFWF
ncbi:uncharacterized protein VTP21DRAFT_6534 [Calcarisporiella thermophila]|uniref:uncharacterized protein n=1 Tax=Calcarisporiella thermophila TaxID=911321 RepID=UPI00374294F6